MLTSTSKRLIHQHYQSLHPTTVISKLTTNRTHSITSTNSHHYHAITESLRMSSTTTTTQPQPQSKKTHLAAILPTPKSPFTIQPTPTTTTPLPSQLLISNLALAINPIDYKLQHHAIYPLPYPTILGQDLAGTILSVGGGSSPPASSSRHAFQPNDTIIACAAGFLSGNNAEKAFQERTIIERRLTCKIPAGMAVERAVVLPLAVTTASAGLFNPADRDGGSGGLGLRVPVVKGVEGGKGEGGRMMGGEEGHEGKKEVVLIWGGAGSVGSMAVQLARAAGYEVVSTASPKNWEAVKRLGAAEVFDYASGTVVEDIVASLEGKWLVGGFDAVGGAGSEATMRVVQGAEGEKRASTVNRRYPEPPEGVSMRFANSLTVLETGIAEKIWGDFLPQALEDGTIVPAPEPVVVGHGLESLQKAVERMGEGISASKIVVTL